MLPLPHLIHIPKHIIIPYTQRIQQHQTAFSRHILMTITKIEIIQNPGTRVAYMHKIIGNLFQFRYFRLPLTRIHIHPCQAEFQSLLNTKIGIVQTLIHATGIIK